jgi:hypothetical protein
MHTQTYGGGIRVWGKEGQREGRRKASPLMGCGGPQDCETLKLPHFLDIWLTGNSEDDSITWWLDSSLGRFMVLISVRYLVDPRACSG